MTDGSTAIASANPPVKHLPTPPTPGDVAVGVRVGGQCMQPLRLRAGAVRQDGELAGDTHPGCRPKHRAVADLRARSAEQGRQVDGVAGVDQPLPELDHPRVHPRDLMDHDDRWAGPCPEHRARVVPVGERGRLEPRHLTVQAGSFRASLLRRGCSRALYERYAVPTSGGILWGIVLANLQPCHQDAWVDYKNDNRAGSNGPDESTAHQ